MTKIICIEGIDGCGKSTQIELLKESFNATYCWLRWKPFFLKPLYFLLSIKNKAKSKSAEQSKITENYYKNNATKSKLFRLKTIRSLWYFFSLIDYLIITKIKIYFSKKKDTDLMIFDRYFYDYIIDQGINFNWSEHKIMLEIKRLMKFFKTPNLIIFLDIKPEIAINRKDDIPSIKYLTDRYNIYNYIAKELNWVFIDATLSIKNINEKIASEIGDLL